VGQGKTSLSLASSRDWHFNYKTIAMGKDDYSSTGGGLKLKGAKPSGIEKKRKKKPTSTAITTSDAITGNVDAADTTNSKSALQQEDEDISRELDILPGADGTKQELDTARKTEAEIRHEEMRRKRLNDRLKKEGLKTHKERVEELNKYLSGLSEHHDMYDHALCSGAHVTVLMILTGLELDLGKTCGVLAQLF
jgi:protein FAM32A